MTQGSRIVMNSNEIQRFYNVSEVYHFLLFQKNGNKQSIERYIRKNSIKRSKDQ
jgi:hypothetical protein